MLPVRPTVHSGAHGEHTLIYLLYIGRGIGLYRWGISNYYPHYYIPPICMYAHTLIYILYISKHILLYTYYISLCVINIYKGMGAA